MRIVFNAPHAGPYDVVFSNFAACEVEYGGIAYPSVEHAYQAQKTLDENERRSIAALETPGKAKKVGRHLQLREDWQEVKCGIMRDLLMLKFSREPFKLALRMTGEAEIVEDASAWNDRVWGLGRNGDGQNLLGKCLMEVREAINREDGT